VHPGSIHMPFGAKIASQLIEQMKTKSLFYISGSIFLDRLALFKSFFF
jgi:hypothetical protein